jgi:hypothetical protein
MPLHDSPTFTDCFAQNPHLYCFGNDKHDVQETSRGHLKITSSIFPPSSSITIGFDVSADFPFASTVISSLVSVTFSGEIFGKIEFKSEGFKVHFRVGSSNFAGRMNFFVG